MWHRWNVGLNSNSMIDVWFKPAPYLCHLLPLTQMVTSIHPESPTGLPFYFTFILSHPRDQGVKLQQGCHPARAAVPSTLPEATPRSSSGNSSSPPWGHPGRPLLGLWGEGTRGTSISVQGICMMPFALERVPWWWVNHQWKRNEGFWKGKGKGEGV